MNGEFKNVVLMDFLYIFAQQNIFKNKSAITFARTLESLVAGVEKVTPIASGLSNIEPHFTYLMVVTINGIFVERKSLETFETYRYFEWEILSNDLLRLITIHNGNVTGCTRV